MGSGYSPERSLDRAGVGLSAQFQQHLGQFGVLFRTAEAVVVSAIATAPEDEPAGVSIRDKAGEGKGVITIRTRLCGEWVEIRVQDTGTGIPHRSATTNEEDAFRPFARWIAGKMLMERELTAAVNLHIYLHIFTYRNK